MTRARIMTQPEFTTLFGELLSTRAHYETLRVSGGSFLDRANTLTRLHELRHNMGLVRNTIL